MIIFSKTSKYTKNAYFYLKFKSLRLSKNDLSKSKVKISSIRFFPYYMLNGNKSDKSNFYLNIVTNSIIIKTINIALKNLVIYHKSFA